MSRVRALFVLLVVVAVSSVASPIDGQPLVFSGESSALQFPYIDGSGATASGFHHVQGTISNAVTETKTSDWGLINIEGLSYCVNPGAPLVPQKNLVFTFEGRYEDIEVAIQSGTVKTGRTKRKLLPSIERKKWTHRETKPPLREEDRAVYDTDGFYPGKWLSYSYGYDGKFTRVYIHLLPIQWNPKTQEILALTDYVLSIGGTRAVSALPSPHGRFTEAQHVVLTPDGWFALADSLAAFHTMLGLTTQAVSVESIYSLYEPAEDPTEPGYANHSWDHITGYEYESAKRIIAYLRDTAAHPFLEHVTILGNAGFVPPSYYFYFQDIHDIWSLYDAWVPSDHYYASPDYDWVDNFCVTRISAHDLADATTYCEKAQAWVSQLDESWVRNVSVAGSRPFATYYYIGEIMNTQVINDGFFSGCSIQKFQKLRGTYTYEAVTDHLLHDDFLWHLSIMHGDGTRLISEGPEGGYDRPDDWRIYGYQLEGYPPKDRLPILLSVACRNGAFDTDLCYQHFDESFGEALLASKGAGIAYIGGSRSNGGTSEFCFIDGNLEYLGVYDTWALLYYYLEAYAEGEDLTLGRLFREAKYRFLAGQDMDSGRNRAAFARFVALCDGALPLPDPSGNAASSEVASINLQNGTAGMTGEYQVGNVTGDENPTYAVSNQEVHDLLTVFVDIDANPNTTEQSGVQGSFELDGLSGNQFLLNRLTDAYEREAWHFSMVTRFAKNIDGDLSDWTDNEILGSDDARDIYPDEFDLTKLYVSYDAEAEYLHFGVPVHLAGDLPEDTRLYYVLAFDDTPRGIINNYEANDPFPLWLYCGFENARVNKLVDIKIPHVDFCPRNMRRYWELTLGWDGYVNPGWNGHELLGDYGVACVGENAIEVSLPASAFDFESFRMAVFSSAYSYEGGQFGIMEDVIPSYPDGPHEPLFGQENAYSISAYVDISDINNPRVPLDFHAQKSGSSSRLSWHAPGLFEGIETYNIYRNGTLVATTPENQTSFIDENPPDGMYAYRVSAVYSDGEADCTGERTVVFGNAALRFDESSILGGHVLVEHDEVLNLTEELTAEAWIRPDPSSFTARTKILDKEAFTLYLNGPAGPFNAHCLLLSSHHTSGPSCFSFTPENSLLPGTWQHVAATYNAATGTVALLINGVAQELSFTTQPSGNITDNRNADLTIGGSTTSAAGTFGGDIDEMRVWNTARSPWEIAQGMLDSLTGDEAGLIAYWRMNETEGMLIDDETMFGHTGRCFNTAWVDGVEPGMSSEDGIRVISLPTTFGLAQNRPNPFSRSTMIQFAVPENADVHIAIYDLAGKLVTTLVEGRFVAGYHVVTWGGNNAGGRNVSSGLYICRMKSGSFSENRKMLLLR